MNPFSMKAYLLPEAIEAQCLESGAETRSSDAASANRTSDHPVLATMLFTLVLFWA